MQSLDPTLSLQKDLKKCPDKEHFGTKLTKKGHKVPPILLMSYVKELCANFVAKCKKIFKMPCLTRFKEYEMR